jgi:hypothetical protein
MLALGCWLLEFGFLAVGYWRLAFGGLSVKSVDARLLSFALSLSRWAAALYFCR